MDKEIIISIKTIIFTFVLVLVAFVVYKLGPIIAVLLVSSLLVISLEPAVQFFSNFTLMNKPLSRGVAVLLTYFILIMSLVVIFTMGIPLLLGQAQKLHANFSDIPQTLQLSPQATETLSHWLTLASGRLFSITYSLYAGLLVLFSVLIFSLYLSLDWVNLKKRFLEFFSGYLLHEISATIDDIELEISHWIKGQLFLMIVIGSVSFLSLVVLDVEYALALGLIAGVLEFVPILGPIVSAVLASAVGFAESPVKGLLVLLAFAIIQQVENNFLVPKVMQKVSGFSPLVILLSLLIGTQIFGIVGAILAVPVTMIGVIIVKRILNYSAGN